MGSVNVPVNNFSGGLIGEKLHNRVDVPSYPSGAAVQENFRSDIQGTLSRRPPLLHVESSADSTKDGVTWEFYNRIDDTYLIDVIPAGARFIRNDALITIPEVTATLSGSWVDRSTNAGSITVAGGQLFLDSDGASKARAEKTITINETSVEHVVKFEVLHGPVDMYVGTSSGASDLVRHDGLKTGWHMLAFTPTGGTAYLTFEQRDDAGRVVDDTVSILAGPDYILPVPYTEANLKDVHNTQIRDVVYLTHVDYWIRRLERRGSTSWSLVRHLPDDGPFGDLNTTDITLAASAKNGEITLTASDDLFTSDDVGVIFELTTPEVFANTVATEADVQSNIIKVQHSAGATTKVYTTVSGTFTATVHLERSVGNTSGFGEVVTFTSAGSNTITHGTAGIYYYRLNLRAGDYTSGTVTMQVRSEVGSQTAACRIIDVTSATSAKAELIDGTQLASTEPTKVWKRGAWNNGDGHPVTSTFAFGRLWFGRGTKVWGSRSDNFSSYLERTRLDGEILDDHAINKEIGTAGSDAIRWLGFLNDALIIGTSKEEILGVANTRSEVISPNNFQFLPGTNEGGAALQPVTTNDSIVFVHRSKRKLIQFTQNPQALSETSFVAVDLTVRVPELMEDDQIRRVAIQGEPEQRIYVNMISGRGHELLFRREGELDVVAWSDIITMGRLESVTVLPVNDEDQVYFTTRRRDSTNTWQRHIERLGPERVRKVDGYGHLDSALCKVLEKPDASAEVSATTGTITVTTDEAAFDSGDVGAMLWINGGRGTIATYVSTTEVTVSLTTDLVSDDAAVSGTWGFAQEATTLTGLTHLANQTVRVYGDRKDHGLKTVSAGGVITLDEGVSMAMVGHDAASRWRSLKLAYGSQKGTALSMPKSIKGLEAIMLYRTGGIRYGPTFETMWDVSLRTPADNLNEPVPYFTGETGSLDYDGGYAPDARICFEAPGPHPATLTGFVPRIDQKDR